MITKNIILSPFDTNGNSLIEQFIPEVGFEKNAAKSIGTLVPELANFLATIKPTKGKTYVLVSALSAMEAYGSNFNADAFPEVSLAYEPPGWENVRNGSLAQKRKFINDWCTTGKAYGYTTFYSGNVFAHHKNYDPFAPQNKHPFEPLGNIIFAVYNSKMKRVELVLELDHELAKKHGGEEFLKTILSGGRPAVSMGTKVPFDVCSVCANVAKTRLEYCEHLRNWPNKMLPNGVKVFAINTRPRFFDLSLVVIGADETSYVLEKVAQAGMLKEGYLGHAARALWRGEQAKKEHGELSLGQRLALARELNKHSTIAKRSIIEKAGPEAQLANDISSREDKLPEETLNAMSNYSLPETLGSSGSMGIVLKPSEFQRVMLNYLGRRDIADELDSNNQVFAPSNETLDCPVTPCLNSSIRDLLLPHLEERSALEPIIQKRITIIQLTSPRAEEVKVSHPLLDKIAAAYNGYRGTLAQGFLEKTAELRLNDKYLRSLFFCEDLICQVGGLEKVATVSLQQHYLENA